jgi:ribosomal protein S18 acetylase RimI-like enzyme
MNNEIVLLQVNPQIEPHRSNIERLVWEYLVWANKVSNEKYNLNYDIEDSFKTFISEYPKYLPPTGRFYLAQSKDEFVGLCGFKQIDEKTAELKRLYVQPFARKQGIAAKLLSKLIQDARLAGYSKLMLESARHMEDAYRLYQTLQFKEVPLYKGVESPEYYRSIIYCMELDISTT